jgi:hypothetical protein
MSGGSNALTVWGWETWANGNRLWSYRNTNETHRRFKKKRKLKYKVEIAPWKAFPVCVFLFS